MPAIFAGSPRKSLLYSAGGYSPGENAVAPDGHGREKWPPPRPRPPPVFSHSQRFLCFFFAARPDFFLPCARHGLRGRSIFPRVLIHAFPRGNCRFTERSSRIPPPPPPPVFLRVSRAFPEAKNYRKFSTGSFLIFERELPIHI